MKPSPFMRLAIVAAIAFGYSDGASAQLISYVDVANKFIENKGAFCPTSRNCTGAYYTQAMFNTARPLKNLKIYLVSGTTTIGQGVTGLDGHVTIGFYWPPPNIFDNKIVIKFEEGNGRWVVHTLTGGFNTRQVSVGYLPYTPNPGSPTTRNITLGTVALPDETANVFDGASKAWLNGLAEDSNLQATFTGISIRGFTSPTGSDCPTSCAIPSSMQIRLSSNGKYTVAVLHEMGHIANYLSHRGGSFSYGGCYSYPSECSGFPGSAGGTWFLDSSEWSSASFEEGLATFAAVAGYYGRNATDPHICSDSAAACLTGVFQVERATSCPQGSAAYPLNVTRYMWDLHDTVSDSEGMEMEMHRVLGTLWSFPEGNANGAEDEPRVPLDPDEDGRSLTDYRKYLSVPTSVWTQNCSASPGD